MKICSGNHAHTANEYKFNGENVDVSNYYNYLLAIFHFIEGSDAWLGNIRGYKKEMKAEYEDERLRNMDWQ